MTSLISKYRTELMGVATLWVMLFHFRSAMSEAPLDYLSSVGYGGVDIFLFLSGFGLFCGYRNNSSPWNFYKRRFLRIYPTYLFLIVLNDIIAKEFGLVSVLVKSTGIGYFLLPVTIVPWFEWYVPTMLLFYLCFPFIYRKLSLNVKWGGVLILTALCFTGVLIFIKPLTLILTASRIPVFIIGSMVGYMHCHSFDVARKWKVAIVVLALVALVVEMALVSHYPHQTLWRNAIYWLPFIFIVPGLCYAVSYFFQILRWTRYNIFRFLGMMSLEAYLIHMIVLRHYKAWIACFIENSTLKLYISFLIFFSVVLICSFIVHKLFNLLLSKYHKKSNLMVR